MSINRVTLFGAVDREPEVRTAPYNPDERVARFSLQTTKAWRNNDGVYESRKTWHKLLVKRENLVSLAEKYINKGSQIMVHGELRTRTNEQTSQRYTEVLVNEITLCSGNAPVGQSASTQVNDSLNMIVLGGHVGGDPKINQTTLNPELQIAKFSLATKKVWNADGVKREHTTWHDIYTMRNELRTQVDEYITKGTFCILVGELTNRKLVESSEGDTGGDTNAASAEAGDGKGNARYITEVNLQRLIVPLRNDLGESRSARTLGNTFDYHSNNSGEDKKSDVDFADDSIPFDDFLEEPSDK